jgi:thioesterase domain-containing protein/malonyl CoA-acyl carrier protein transacylase
LSARTRAALDTATERLAAYLAEHPELPLADVAFTLQQGRAHMLHRRAVLASDLASAKPRILTRDPAFVFTDTVHSRKPRLIFMFPGGGTQRVHMGQELYAHEPIYRQALDQCASLFQSELGCDIRSYLYADADQKEAAAQALLRPSLNNAVIFSTEYALAELLLSLGLKPAATTGHSLGEYTAAWLAGVLDLPSAVSLVALRGRIYDSLPDGAAMSVNLPESTLSSLLSDGLEIAAVNGPASCLVSGQRAAILALQARLLSQGHDAQLLAIDCAVHSRSVEPQLPRLTERALTLQRRAPRIPVVSNLTGKYLTEEEAGAVSYWARHLRGTVRFFDGLTTLLADDASTSTVFLEVGPGWTLSSLCRRHPAAVPQRLALGTLSVPGSSRSDLETLLGALAQLHCMGIEVDWARWSAGERRRRVPLPTYPFERTLYDLDTRVTRSEAVRTGAEAPLVSAVGRVAAAAPASLELSGKGAAAASSEESDPLLQALADLWKDALGVAPGPFDNFFDHGGSSFVAVQLCSKLRDELRVGVPVHALVQRPTFRAFAEHVRGLKKDGGPEASQAPKAFQNSLLVQFQTGEPTQTPLFLIQPIGGTVYTYAPLCQQLDPRLPIYGIRASGMEPGEEVLSELPSIVALYLKQVRSVQPQGPYLLGGHSAGGIIAWAMAQELMLQGQGVRAVFMIDSASMYETQRSARLNFAQLLAELQRPAGASSKGQSNLLVALQQDTPFRAIAIHTLQALATLKPRPLRTELVYILAQDEPNDSDPDRASFWMEFGERAFHRHKVPGDHFTTMEPPWVAAVSEIFRAQLRLI